MLIILIFCWLRTICFDRKKSYNSEFIIGRLWSDFERASSAHCLEKGNDSATASTNATFAAVRLCSGLLLTRSLMHSDDADHERSSSKLICKGIISVCTRECFTNHNANWYIYATVPQGDANIAG